MKYIREVFIMKENNEPERLIKAKKKLVSLMIILAIGLIMFYIIDIECLLGRGNAVPIVKINGDSMEPTYHDGQLLTYYTVDKKPVENGSVIIYYTSIRHLPVVHRVVQINQDGTLITRGDNNPDTDQAMGVTMSNVTQEQVYAVIDGPLLG
jgi:signal peptidase I